MPKSSDELTKHTLNLFAGDFAKLQALFPDIGAAIVIRKITRQFIQRTEAGTDETPDVKVVI